MSEKIKTPEGQLSFPFLFVAKAKMNATENDRPRFSTAIVFPKDTDLTELKQLVLDAALAKFGEKAPDMFRSKALRTPFRTDGEAKGYGPDTTFITAWSHNRPGVVSIYPDPDNDGKPTVITADETEKVYPGVIAKLLVSCFGYDNSGNKGVSFSLAGVQIRRKGDRLDGSIAATDAFDADKDAVADLSDLTGDDGPSAASEGSSEASSDEVLNDLM